MFRFYYSLLVSGSLKVQLYFQVFSLQSQHQAGFLQSPSSTSSTKAFVHFRGFSAGGLHERSNYRAIHNRIVALSASWHMAGWAGSWPGRNRKSKRMCSSSVNSTCSLEDGWDRSPRGLFPHAFVIPPIFLHWPRFGLTDFRWDHVYTYPWALRNMFFPGMAVNSCWLLHGEHGYMF